ncbi:carbohydrate ABC transporter permease [Microbacterium sp. AK031]|uniref:carbohydrate ABC transporter permease n=1 Tax=Microbacterium sp. AK031 TaxID=2723076 RepID=UPI00216A8704|nr:sugar ABC transporter permease [Microbacterium sp. AK031]MCS3844104.1 multiple sugar transport system permease protein [Microbacterium sp. AK031]
MTLQDVRQADPTRVPPTQTKPSASRRKRRGDGLAAAGFLAPMLGGFGFFTLLPILAGLALAFMAWPLLGDPEFVGIDNFVRLFTQDSAFIQSLGNTLVFVVFLTPLNLVLSLLMATWISPRVRYGNGLRVLFFIPVVTPMVANAAVWQLMLIPNGLIDATWREWFGTAAPNFLGDPQFAMASVIGMSLWQGFGYNLMIFTAALNGVPDNLLEAASIDGAGPVRTFFSIRIPQISPAIFFATTMTLISSFQVFAQPYVLTGGGPNNATTTLAMRMYDEAFSFLDLGYASAIGVVLFGLILLVSALLFASQRKLVHYE